MAPSKITAPALVARKSAGPKIVMVTAYDATMARLLDEAGVDVLLVGDSLGMVVQGRRDTLAVTVEEICYHSKAVVRGSRHAHVVADLPFMSFQVSPEQALDSAGKLVKLGGAESVKLEGGVVVAEQVRRIVAAGIPVLGHVGLLPQSVHAMGGFRVQGKEEAAARRILQDAVALQEAGAWGVVLEGVPSGVAQQITATLSVPTIGIGAGPHCDGQVLVCYDLLGMYRDVKPKFVKRFAELGDAVVSAARSYADEVRSGAFPDAAHSFAGGPQPVDSTGAAPVVGPRGPGYGPADEA